nr:DUF6318 family protein [Helcobacillus sp. ACRRO]
MTLILFCAPRYCTPPAAEPGLLSCSCGRYCGAVSKSAQRLVILICALALVVPVGLVGFSNLNGGADPSGEQNPSAPADPSGSGQGGRAGQQDPSADPNAGRKKVDPASQPKPTATKKPAAPAAMSQPTDAGALATTDYLFAAYPPMIATGDVSQWGEIIAPECKECGAFMQNSAQLHQAGGWVVGGDITLTDPKAEVKKADGDPTASHTATVTSPFTEKKSILIDDPQYEGHVNPGSKGEVTVSLKYSTEKKAWKVTGIALK